MARVCASYQGTGSGGCVCPTRRGNCCIRDASYNSGGAWTTICASLACWRPLDGRPCLNRTPCQEVNIVPCRIGRGPFVIGLDQGN